MRCYAGDVLEQAQEMVPRIAGTLGERRQRRRRLARLDQVAGGADGRGMDGGPLALRVAPLAGAEAIRLRRRRISIEAHIPLERRARGAAGPAIDPLGVTA
jgi:hypothetical protein